MFENVENKLRVSSAFHGRSFRSRGSIIRFMSETGMLLRLRVFFKRSNLSAERYPCNYRKFVIFV